METIYVGADGFANEASRDDDLGGGVIYAALIRQAILKRLGAVDANILTQYSGTVSKDLTLGTHGAVIADTTDKSNIPMQLVCPTGFATALDARIYSETGHSIADCTVGEYLDGFIEESDAEIIPGWETFATWFDGYRSSIDEAITDANVTFQTIDGDSFAGTVRQMGEITKMSDIFVWTKSMMPIALLEEPVASITADNNPNKLGFIATITGLSEDVAFLIGSTTITMRFYFRL